MGYRRSRGQRYAWRRMRMASRKYRNQAPPPGTGCMTAVVLCLSVIVLLFVLAVAA